MSEMIMDSEHPQSYDETGIELVKADVTTDSNGVGTVTVNFNKSINYSSNQECGFWVTPTEFCDWKYGNVGASSVDISVRNAPASRTFTLTVVRMASLYTDL